jgi:DNA-nicking Smr family endonuclease
VSGRRPSDPGPASAEPEPGSSGEDIVSLPIEDFIDLHPFAPRDIPSVVEEYLREARAKGFREVRLIHGKGIGFQRERVRQLLATLEEVESFRDAPADRGHWGATAVLLKPAKD